MIGVIRILFIIILGAIALLFVLAPYAHIFFDKTDIVKVFGFRNLRSFLYSIGLPLSLFLCSSLLLYSSKHMIESSPKVFLKTMSFLFLWSSIFQFLWIFWEGKDLPTSFYYLSLFLLSCLFSFFYCFFVLYRKATIYKLQQSLTAISRFTFITSDKYIKENSKEEYNKGLLKALKKGMD